MGNGTIEVLSTGGDPHLGGNDWDQLVVDWLKEKIISASQQLQPSGGGSNGGGAARLDFEDPGVQANLRGLAELAKIQLSTADVVKLR